MAKITEADRAECTNMQVEYKEALESTLKKIKNYEIQASKMTDEMQLKECKMHIALLELVASSNILAFTNISSHYINLKIENDLNDARIHLNKVIILLEEILGTSTDDSLTYNEGILEYLSTKITDEWKYEFISGVGYMLDLLKDTYGDNSKWKNSFLELEYRLIVIAKNFINYKTFIRDSGPDVDGHKIKIKLMKFVKENLSKLADLYRMKYELADRSIDDMRVALKLNEALRSIHAFLGEVEQASEEKKKSELWKKKLDADINMRKK